MVNTVLHCMGQRGDRLTVGVEGSFGVLHYAVLAFTAGHPKQPNVDRWPLQSAELQGRGFRPARNADVEDIVLKAQPADGSIQCRASTEGLVSLLVDYTLVWSRQFNPEDVETALWLEAARTRGVAIVSGQPLRIGETEAGGPGGMEHLMMARIPTVWTR